MTDTKQYTTDEITLIQWTARLNELRRMKEFIDDEIEGAMLMCNRWQREVNEAKK